MSIKLYVNHISGDGAMAIAMDKETVSYNLLALDQGYNKESPVFAAGKYVCLLIPEDEHNLEMMFFDFNKNPENLEEIMKSTEYDESIKKQIASVAETVDASNPSNIELVVGDVPVIPL